MTATETAKYEIPAHLLEMVAKYAESCGSVLYRGVYVDTKCGAQTWSPEEGICALCDGTGTVPCQTCDGEAILIAETPDGDEDEYAETPCPSKKCRDGQVACPQSRAKWCHEG